MSPHLHIEMLRAHEAELTRNAENHRRTALAPARRSEADARSSRRIHLGFAFLRLARS